jgi:DNA-binding CsgD family transcriptional regulator
MLDLLLDGLLFKTLPRRRQGDARADRIAPCPGASATGRSVHTTEVQGAAREELAMGHDREGAGWAGPGPLPGRAAQLRGRREQLAEIRAALQALTAGRGGIRLVLGLPGTGKSALLDAAEDLARPLGVKVARGSGLAATTTVPFGVLLSALAASEEPLVDPRELRELSRSPDQRFWLLQELQDQVERAAATCPVMIMLDDLQWADEASLSAVATLPRHTASHRVLWLLAARSSDRGAGVLSAIALLEAAGALSLNLSGLDEVAVGEITRDILGAPPDPALRTVLNGVHGQPFLLVELLRGLSEDGSVRIDGGLATAPAKHVPTRFGESVATHLSTLSPQARAAARMAAVLGRRLSVEELSAFTGHPASELMPVVDELLRAGVLVEDGRWLGFRHDLVREAIDGSLPTSTRDSLRRKAVDVMLTHGAGPAGVASLVLDIAGPGDLSGIRLLRRASAEIGRVSPAVAAPLSRRALELTPGDDPSRGSQILETIEMLVLAGQAGEASRLLSASAEHLITPEVEAETRLDMAMALMHYSPPDAVEQCRTALSLGSLPPGLRMHLGSVLSCGLDIEGDRRGAALALRKAQADAAAAGATGDWGVLIPQSLAAIPEGRWQEALDCSGEAVRLQHVAGRVNLRIWRPEAWRAIVLLGLARPGEAMRLIDAGEHLAQAEGVPGKARVWMMLRARALMDLGRISDAVTEAEAIFDMSDELGAEHVGYLNDVASWVGSCTAIRTGDPHQLAAAAQSASRLRSAELAPSRALGALLAASLGSLAGRPDATKELDESTLAALSSPALQAGSPRSHADIVRLVRLLLADDRTAEASSVAAALEQAAGAQPGAGFLAAAARHARALAEADAGLAAEAAAMYQDDERPLIRAEALEDAGRLLPDERRDGAVGHLDAALTLYATAGATQDAARVRGLLRARGVRRVTLPSPDPQWPELTESERAVVALVAEGATNREVADRLFISPYTVNSHLRHIFSKLEIRSRVELARLAMQRGVRLGQ